MWPSYANLTSIKTSPDFCTHGRVLEIHGVGPQLYGQGHVCDAPHWETWTHPWYKFWYTFKGYNIIHVKYEKYEVKVKWAMKVWNTSGESKTLTFINNSLQLKRNALQ